MKQNIKQYNIKQQSFLKPCLFRSSLERLQSYLFWVLAISVFSILLEKTTVIPCESLRMNTNQKSHALDILSNDI